MGKKILKNKIKNIGVLILCGAMTLSLVACEKQGEADPVVNKEEGYVYVPEYIALSKEEGNSYFDHLTLNGETVYYSEYAYDAETETSQQSVFRLSMKDGSKEQISLALEQDKSLNCFIVDDDGNLITVSSVYNEDNVSEEGYSIPDIFLGKYDAQGTELFDEDITHIMNSAGDDTYVQSVLVDAQGNIYLCTGSIVFLFREDGSAQGTVSIDSGWINGMAVGKDGKVYFCHYDYTSSTGGMVLSEIDFEGKKIANTYKNLPSMNGNGLTAGIEKDILINGGTKVYEYELSTQTCEEVFTWLDSDINGDYVRSLGALEDGTIVAVIQDWESGVTEIAKMVRKEAGQVAEKETVTIGSLYNDQELQAAAVAFNKSNDKYRITIKNYVDENNMDENAYNTAITNLQNDIVSGDDGPDILDLSQIGGQGLISKGAFEDLTPYLEKSSVLTKDGFVDNVLEGYIYDGKLIAIPSRFGIETVVGKTSIVGEKMGWSLEELMAFAKEHPDAALFEEQKSSALYSCMLYNQGTFVDWEKGECYFDTDAFKQVLEFANLFPEEIDWSVYDEAAELEKLKTGETLLQRVYLYDLQEVQVYEAKFGEPVTFIGYPTSDGSVGCSLATGSQYSITSKSKHKDGAWAFIEYYLTADGGDRYYWGFPALKDQFEKMVEDAITPDYMLDENGDPMLDENGEPIEMGGMTSISSNGWSYTYHTPTQGEADTLRELISVAKVAENLDSEVMSIILEEAEAYFKGQKSIDDVADIIQSRVKIYISENS